MMGLMIEGKPVKIGLRREEGHNILDSRVIDGFNVKMYGGDRVCLSYHIEEQSMKSVHNKNFESDIEQTISEVKSFIEKQFRKNTGKSLSLKKQGEVLVEVNPISRIRVQILAKQHYTVGSLSEVEDPDTGRGKDPLIKATEDFLSLATDKKAKNDDAPTVKSDPFNPNKMSFGIRK